MENLALKIKLAMLWLLSTVAFLVVMILSFLEPGVIEQIMAGELYGMKLTSGELLGSAIFLLIPLVMTFLSLTLKDSINRWANIILGAVFTILYIVSLIEAFRIPSPPAYGILLEIASILATALITWYAWKWAKE